MKAATAFRNTLAVLNSKVFLVAWMAAIAIGFFVAPNPFSAALILGATWVIDLVVIGDLGDHQGIYMFLLFLFPAIFTWAPIKLYQGFSRLRGARHANP